MCLQGNLNVTKWSYKHPPRPGRSLPVNHTTVSEVAVVANDGRPAATSSILTSCHLVCPHIATGGAKLETASSHSGMLGGVQGAGCTGRAVRGGVIESEKQHDVRLVHC